MTTIVDVWRAYDGAQGRWSGCSWPTHYGSLGFNLDGVSSDQAHRAAERWRAIAADEVASEEVTGDEENSLAEMALHLRLGRRVVCQGEGPDRSLLVRGSRAVCFCAGVLAKEWKFAAYWLEEIESDARWAEEEAREAVDAAEDGEWGSALGHARHACLIESGYEVPRAWQPLKRAIERVTLYFDCVPLGDHESDACRQR